MDKVISMPKLISTIVHNHDEIAHICMHMHPPILRGSPLLRQSHGWTGKNIKLTSAFAALLEAASWMTSSKKVYKMRAKKQTKTNQENLKSRN